MAAARDTSIVVYRKRRDFATTPEPPARAMKKRGRAPIFVVQKHQASHLHWDFRLEHGGVLLSWAVPKGPSLDPANKRLAMHVEDHPLDYAGFSGIIPERQYGAGTVEIWDRGTWEAVGDPDDGFARGDFKFVLHGSRLNGRFVLVRMKRSWGSGEPWLLIKERDGMERPGFDAAALEATPPSVAKTPVKKTRAAKRSVSDDAAVELAGTRLSHPDRALWPGITKRNLAEYWLAVARWALPAVADRPLALVRCPDGVDGEHFFQKHGRPGMPQAFHAGEADGAPYLSIADEAGLVAAAQMAAIELHTWGSSLADPLHPDRLVFDLDPGDDIAFAEVARSARDLRDRLQSGGYASFCRTSGGKGLHVVVPLRPRADWSTARAWCRDFAETLAAEQPERYVAAVAKEKRRGHILIDWLRNGLGSTAAASFCPRARPGAPVATPLAWREVTARLDPSKFTIRTVPARLKRQRHDPWAGFAEADQRLEQR